MLVIMNRQKLKIGDLAKRSGLTVEALRFYEKQQLLIPQGRSESGYRLYAETDVQRLRFILHAKQVGFTLGEIQQLLALRSDKDEHSCGEVKEYTAQKLAEVEKRLQDLRTIQKALSRLHDACCGGPEKASHCSILAALDDDDFTQKVGQ